MKTFEKIYLGKGKKVANLDIVKVTCKLEELQAIAYEYEGTEYVTFEVARMKTADDYGRTHSVYYSKMNEVADTPAKNGKKPRKLKKLAEVVDPLPF
ncbi:MAG: hypothetical protein NTV01_08105 [Bacteroidia bacterium]|nr:hypothetical protein [Bacteroidia bacterium]